MKHRARLLLAILVLTGIVCSVLVWVTVYALNVSVLQRRVDSLAYALPEDELVRLTGTDRDLRSASYTQLKQRLTNIRNSNFDVRFLYIVDMQDGVVRFLIDSEDPDSDEYSAPGDMYPEASDSFKRAITDSTSIVEGPIRDSFGLWVSGVSSLPAVDRQMAIGMDISASRLLMTTTGYATIPIIIVMVVSSAFVVDSRARRKLQAVSEQKNQIVLITSHDLISPLVALKLANEAAAANKDVYKPHEFAGVLDRVISSMEYVLAIASDKVTIDQTQRGARNVCPLINGAVQNHQLMAKNKGVELLIGFDCSMLSIDCVVSENAVTQVFNNLISNAVKYTQQGGSVHVDYAEDKGSYVFMVSDQGHGIPAGEQGQVFTHGFRASNTQQAESGHGVGLHAVKELVESEHGALWFKSTEGSGTTFYVSLVKS